MKEKIKNFFVFIKSGWQAGPRGKIGLLLILLSLFFFARLFSGNPSIQSFISNALELSEKQKLRDMKKAEENRVRLHKKLYETESPDFIEEMGLKSSNFGDPGFKRLNY